MDRGEVESSAGLRPGFDADDSEELEEPPGLEDGHPWEDGPRSEEAARSDGGPRKDDGPDLSILDDLEVELRDVEHALRRLEDGSYGVCEVCGDPISESRLEANPVTRACCADHAAQ